MKTIIRKMVQNDISAVARVHSLAFKRQIHSEKWIECNFRAFPRIQYYVAVLGSQIVGYIEWIQKSGFRQEVVLELEQIAVTPNMHSQGIGRMLIVESLSLVKDQLSDYGSILKHIIVTTRADNYAQKLYTSTFGARVECLISDLYSADEVIMIARNV